MSAPRRRVRVLLVGAMTLASMVVGCGDEQAVNTGGTSGGTREPRIPTFEEAALRSAAASHDGIPVEESVEAHLASYRRSEASDPGFALADNCENYRDPAWWTEFVLGLNPESAVRSAAAECPHTLAEIAEAAAEALGTDTPGQSTTPISYFQEMIARYDSLADQAVDL